MHMKKIVIKGKKDLTGEINISGAKNSVVALIPAISSLFILKNLFDEK